MVQILIDRQIDKQQTIKQTKTNQTNTPRTAKSTKYLLSRLLNPQRYSPKKSSESGFGWKPRAYVPCICTYLYAYIVHYFWTDAP